MQFSLHDACIGYHSPYMDYTKWIGSETEGKHSTHHYFSEYDQDYKASIQDTHS